MYVSSEKEALGLEKAQKVTSTGMQRHMDQNYTVYLHLFYWFFSLWMTMHTGSLVFVFWLGGGGILEGICLFFE